MKYGEEDEGYMQELTDEQRIKQKIALIRQQVRQNGEPYVDDEFKANDSSLYKDPNQKPDYALDAIVEWKRPEAICPGEDPAMIKDGMTSGDVKQGQLGDCWLLGSFLLLGTRP